MVRGDGSDRVGYLPHYRKRRHPDCRQSQISEFSRFTVTRDGDLGKMRSLPGHSFWPDDVSLVGSGDIAPTKILTSGQVTDTYLLALAKARGGQLATFDRKLSAAAVTRGNSALHLITATRVR